MYNKSLTFYTISHFVVDFACFYILTGMFSNTIKNLMTISLAMLLYNIIAFGLQMFIGYFADEHSIGHSSIAISGCILICFGVLLVGLCNFTSWNAIPWIALALCAFGNACFHIGGGINALVYADGKMARGGIFVSSGAIGVVLGTLAGKAGIQFWLPALLLLLCSIAIYAFCRTENDKTIPYHYCSAMSKTKNSNRCISGKCIIYLCLISIAVRSFAGFEITIVWKTNALLFILPGLCAFIGKFSGGILADKFGAKNIGVSTLLISIPLLCFFSKDILLCSAGLIALNMTMSITLWGIAAQLATHPGFAFGLTTLALLAGNLPVFFLQMQDNVKNFVLPILIFISAICIFISIDNKMERKYYDQKDNPVPEKLPL